ncbi:MAG: hypothetical protein Q7S23_02230 [bacterium]|nr:hypothetical protein [bacterium]
MRWSGFAFSVPLMTRLVTLGMQLLREQGVTDEHDRRRLCLRSRRMERYGEISVGDWNRRRPDRRVGLFFWGAYRPPRPVSRFPWWSWQTPRAPAFITPDICYSLRSITDGQIRTVLRFLQLARPISALEFTCARLHLP